MAKISFEAGQQSLNGQQRMTHLDKVNGSMQQKQVDLSLNDKFVKNGGGGPRTGLSLRQNEKDNSRFSPQSLKLHNNNFGNGANSQSIQ